MKRRILQASDGFIDGVNRRGLISEATVYASLLKDYGKEIGYTSGGKYA